MKRPIAQGTLEKRALVPTVSEEPRHSPRARLEPVVKTALYRMTAEAAVRLERLVAAVTHRRGGNTLVSISDVIDEGLTVLEAMVDDGTPIGKKKRKQ